MIVRLGLLIAASIAAYKFQQNVNGSKLGTCANSTIFIFQKQKICLLVSYL
jgi:hypothetical protein